MKRRIDLILGTVFALLVLPLVLLSAVGVAVSLRCSPFFVQRRIGYQGREF